MSICLWKTLSLSNKSKRLKIGFYKSVWIINSIALFLFVHVKNVPLKSMMAQLSASNVKTEAKLVFWPEPQLTDPMESNAVLAESMDWSRLGEFT